MIERNEESRGGQRGSGRRLRCLGGTFALFSALAMGCQSSHPEPPDFVEHYPNEFAGAPNWVIEGCASYWNEADDEARLCGVGSARVGDSMDLARQKAGSRARVEISRTLETKVRNMIKDYQEQVTDGQAEMNAEQFTSTTMTLSKATLNGVAQRATWLSGSGQLYMLSALDVESFDQSVRDMDEMSDRLRGFIESRSRRSFRELDEAMEEY